MSTVQGFAPSAAPTYFENLVHAAANLASALFAPLPAKASGDVDKTEIFRAVQEARAFSPSLAKELNAIACRY